MKPSHALEMNPQGSFVATATATAQEARNLDLTVAQVQRFPLFAGLSLDTCKGIVTASHELKFNRSQTIFAQGHPIRQVLLLTLGCVKVSQLDPNGMEVIPWLNVPGEIIGNPIFTTESFYGSTARALQSSTALAWNAPQFEAIAERFPALRRNMMRFLSERLGNMEERFCEISTQNAAARLAREIVRLTRRIGRPVVDGIEIALSREEIGQLIGATLFTVCRLLCDWERQGIVANRRGTVIVRNREALLEMSNN